MPKAVFDEIIKGHDASVNNVIDAEDRWLKVESVSEAKEVLVWNLGDGETEVLSHCLNDRNGLIAMVDDRAARKCAETLKIRTLGTAGFVILAKKYELISSVEVELNKLKKAGLYLSDELFAVIISQANKLK